MRQGVYGFVLGIVVGGMSGFIFVHLGEALLEPARDPLVARTVAQAEQNSSEPDRVLPPAADHVTAIRVPVDAVSIAGPRAVEEQVEEPDARIAEVNAMVPQVQTLHLVAQYAGFTDVDGDPVEMIQVDNMFAQR